MSELIHKGGAAFHLAQAAFLMSQAGITVALAGIRGGKTHAGAAKTIFYALAHPCADDEVHLVCSPTFPMSKVPIEKMWRLLNDKSLFPVSPLLKYNKSERMFVLMSSSGSVTRIKVASLHDPNKIRGIKALSAWLDEGAYITSEAWDIVLGRVADVNGPIWITTTPAGYNFIHELYERALAEKKAGIPLAERSIRFIHWGSAANPYMDADGRARLVANYDSRTYQQEVEALFVRLAGTVYYAYGKHNLASWTLNRKSKVYVGQDFNVMAMASVLTQQDGDNLRVFDERLCPGDTYGLVAWMDRWCMDNQFHKKDVWFYPDASGAARSTAGKSDTRILKEAGYRVEYSKRNPFVKDRVNCVNGLLKPHAGTARMTITPDLIHVPKTFEKQIWDGGDPPAPDKEKGFDHIADAVGYVAWGRLPLAVTATLGTTHDIRRRAA